jgi:hypothetical protein
MQVGPGEIKKELTFPADIFEADDLKTRRAGLYQQGVRSRLVFHAETADTVAYYDLTLVGPEDKMVHVGLLFSYFDDSEFSFPTKHRPHKMG